LSAALGDVSGGPRGPAETTTTTAAPDTTAADSTVTTTTDQAATRTVETMDGLVEIPADPQRIVAISDQNALLPLIELGVIPVASHGITSDDGEEFFRRTDGFDTSAVEWIGDLGTPNVEAVAAQRPDLIVTDRGAGADVYDQLVEIAPVVRLDQTEPPLTDNLMRWADIVGRSDRATELQSEYEDRLAEVIEALGDPGEITLAMVTSWDSGATFWYVDGGQATNQVFNDLTLTRTDAWGIDSEFSIEGFPDHTADFVVVYDFGGREQPDISIDALVESPLFLAHPAVAAGQWARVDATQTVGSAWVKLQNLLDILEPLLADPELDRSIAP
jgi:iron complex transport system substrate-binding protein